MEQPHAGASFVADYGDAVLSAALRFMKEKRAELLAGATPKAAE